MLSATHLSKSYGGRAAVFDVSLRLTPGRVLGLLGPNGAGKSTTVAMLCGLLPPERGDVAFDDGVSLTAGRVDAFKRRIGLVPQDLALYEELPARQNLTLFGALYGMHGAALGRRVDAALDLVGLRDRAKDRRVLGVQRRLAPGAPRLVAVLGLVHSTLACMSWSKDNARAVDFVYTL